MAGPDAVSNNRSTSIEDVDLPPPSPAGQQGNAPAKNTTASHDQSTPNAQHSDPTSASRESTKTVDQEVAERLASNPDYQAAQAEYEKWKDLMTLFNLVDRNTGIGPDNRIEYANLVALRDDPGAKPEAREAARRLLDSDMFTRLAKDDQWIGSHDVTTVLNELKSAVDSIKSSVTEQVNSERGVQASPTQGSSAGALAGNGDAAPGGAAPTPSTIPAPAPSTLPGLDGAVENLANQADYIDKQIEQLINNKEVDPAQKAAQLSRLQSQQQAMLNMMNQIQQARSNTMKLWSEIAMNSVRNIK